MVTTTGNFCLIHDKRVSRLERCIQIARETVEWCRGRPGVRTMPDAIHSAADLLNLPPTRVEAFFHRRPLSVTAEKHAEFLAAELRAGEARAKILRAEIMAMEDRIRESRSELGLVECGSHGGFASATGAARHV